MYTREAIVFDPLADMHTSYGPELFKNGVIVGENATVMFGPYVSLPAGKWTVRVAGQITPNGRCYVDAATGQGNLILGEKPWTEGNCAFEIECAFPAEGFEVRIYAASGSFVRIDGISVERQIQAREIRSFSLWDRMGLSLFLDKTSLVDRALIEGGAWEPDHLNYLTKTALRYADSSRDMVFLDIGAYFGLYAMVMARTNLFGKIVAFEADPLNFRQLCANLLTNDPHCLIEPRFIAVSDEPGEITYASSLHHPDGNRGGVGVNEGASVESTDTILVKTEKIDTLVPLKGKRIIAKIDVEGHEPRVLAGMRRLLVDNKAFLQIETFYKLQEIKDILEPLGYRAVHRIKDDHFFTNFEEVSG